MKYKIKFFLLIFLILNSTILSSHNLNYLLQNFKKESALSKKTKKYDAGILYLYTRDDLNKMQAKNLMDILKTVPGVNLYRTENNFIIFSTASNPSFPLSGVRIFINNHDMTSAFFGSGFLIYGEIGLDYIDHIEIYKATSSIEFGNETAPIVIKLYTKKSNREVGSKIDIMTGERGSSIVSIYNAKQINNNFSYFIYGNFRNIKNKEHHQAYNNKRYDYNSGHKDGNFYANFAYKNYFLEIGGIDRKLDNFIGIGLHKTPDKDKNRLNEAQKYIHITKKIKNGYRIQFSIDKINYKEQFYDPNGIYFFTKIPNTFYISPDSKMSISDISYSVIVDKTIHLKNSKLFFGGFYKYKTFKGRGYTSGLSGNSRFQTYHNNLSYFSLYIENNYYITPKVTLISSAKEDFYRYKKSIKKYKKLTYKIALHYKDRKWLNQVNFIRGYIPTTLYQTYDFTNIDTRANNLIVPTYNISLLTIRRYFENNYINLAIGKHQIKNPIKYMLYRGNINLPIKTKYNLAELTYHYNIDSSNKIEIAYYTSNNHTNKLFSPKLGVIIRAFNNHNKFNFYNELIYKSAYQNIKTSFDWTSSIKYNITKDFSIGLRGENIFNKGLKQTYRGVGYPITLQDRKVWLNLEHLF